MDEKEFLDKVADTYKTDYSPISKWNIDAYLSKYTNYIEAGYCKGLELGCSSGYSSIRLSECVNELDVVDGSKKMLEKLKNVIADRNNISCIYALFEELTCAEEYDYVFCSYVLEHVEDPLKVLQVAYQALKAGGKCFVTVPNAKALSRQMALHMGIIDDLYKLTENDLAHGHRRVYDFKELENLVQSTSFQTIKTGGTFMKPFADFQLNKMIEQNIINEEQLQGMQELAEIYPDISGSIYAVLEKT